ncbi:hypothetical protein GZH46_00059, partial [Fragariocoptes setiger]
GSTLAHNQPVQFESNQSSSVQVYQNVSSLSQKLASINSIQASDVLLANESSLIERQDDGDIVRNYITHEKTLVLLEFRRATPTFSEPRPSDQQRPFNHHQHRPTQAMITNNNKDNIESTNNNYNNDTNYNNSNNDDDYEMANNSLGPPYALIASRDQSTPRDIPLRERSSQTVGQLATLKTQLQQKHQPSQRRRRRLGYHLRVRRSARPEPFMRLINGHEYFLVACDMWDLDKRPTLMGATRPPRADGPPPLARATRVDFNTIEEAIVECRQLAERQVAQSNTLHDENENENEGLLDVSRVLTTMRGVLPGTKWCGLGDLASSYSDLGERKNVDICCRAHDHCSMRLKPLKKGYGLHNIALYTKSNCVCDADFYQCLKGANTTLADVLGHVYFNIMKLQCIKEQQVKTCKKFKPIALGFEKCAAWSDEPRKISYKFIYPPTINNCREDGTNSPCPIHQGQTISATASFTPRTKIDSVKVKIQAKVGPFKLSFPVDPKEACGNYGFNCPLIPGTKYNFKFDLPLKKSYPSVKCKINFKLIDNHDDNWLVDINSVTINDCLQDGTDEPCPFVRGNNTKASLDFTTKTGIAAVRVRMQAMIGPFKIPFPVRPEEACGNHGFECPLLANTKYNFNIELPIKSSYPLLSGSIIFRLLDHQDNTLNEPIESINIRRVSYNLMNLSGILCFVVSVILTGATSSNFTGVSSDASILYLVKMEEITSFSSLMANLLPIQLRGPKPNGMNAAELRRANERPAKRSGL